MSVLRFGPLVLKQVARHRVRTLLTLSGIAIAMFLFTSVQAMQRGVTRATAAAAGDTTLVVYMGGAQITEIAENLMAHGLSRTTPVLAVSNASTSQAWRCLSRLDQIAADIPQGRPSGPVLFVIGRVVSLYRGATTEILDRLRRQLAEDHVDA